MCKCSCESDNSAPWQLFKSYQYQAESQGVMNWMRARPPRERREKPEDACMCPTGKLSDQDTF